MLGLAQIAAGALLMTKRFAPLAALVLFAVTINIAAINVALWPDFGTTMLLTAYALAGLSLLLVHDRHAWMPLLRGPAPETSPR